MNVFFTFQTTFVAIVHCKSITVFETTGPVLTRTTENRRALENVKQAKISVHAQEQTNKQKKKA